MMESLNHVGVFLQDGIGLPQRGLCGVGAYGLGDFFQIDVAGRVTAEECLPDFYRELPKLGDRLASQAFEKVDDASRCGGREVFQYAITDPQLGVYPAQGLGSSERLEGLAQPRQLARQLREALQQLDHLFQWLTTTAAYLHDHCGCLDRFGDFEDGLAYGDQGQRSRQCPLPGFEVLR